MISVCLAGSWLVFREIGTHSRTCNGCHVSTFGSGRDNFFGIRVVDFLNFYSVFTSLIDIGCIPVIVYYICEFEYLSLFVDKMNIPPRRGRDRPRRVLVDEEADSTP